MSEWLAVLQQILIVCLGIFVLLLYAGLFWVEIKKVTRNERKLPKPKTPKPSIRPSGQGRLKLYIDLTTNRETRELQDMEISKCCKRGGDLHNSTFNFVCDDCDDQITRGEKFMVTQQHRTIAFICKGCAGKRLQAKIDKMEMV